MKTTSLLISFLLFTFFAFPQFESSKRKNKGGNEIEKQYEDFKKTFDKEFEYESMEEVDGQELQFEYPLPPAELPAWMLDGTTVTGNGELLVFGISDPGLDSTLAMEQAKIRALGLLSIFSSAEIQNITDVYSNEMGGDAIIGKFSSYSKIESYLNYSLSHLKLIKQGFTSFGEAIVLAGIEVQGMNTSDIKGRVIADYFLSEEGEYDDLFVYSTLNFDLKLRNNLVSEYSCHSTRKNILITSKHKSERLDFEYGRFKYYLPQEIAIADDELLNYSYSDLRDGLWNAYLSAILRQIEMADKRTSEIKQMGDQYAGKFQTLTREISNLKLSFELTGFFVKDNAVYIKLAKVQ